MTVFVETQKAYLGVFEVDLAFTPFADYTPADWALHYMRCYGGIDGDHHKAWVLDQVARILKGTPVIVQEARWAPHPGHLSGIMEYRFHTGDPTGEYFDWVKELRGEYDPENDEHEYGYDCGIAP